MGSVCAIDICFALFVHHDVYLEAHSSRNKLVETKAGPCHSYWSFQHGVKLDFGKQELAC